MDERISTFKDEADAFAQCEAAGYHAMKFDFQAEDNDFHWHDFDSMTFITSGELTVYDVNSGESMTCGAGTKIIGRKRLCSSRGHRRVQRRDWLCGGPFHIVAAY